MVASAILSPATPPSFVSIDGPTPRRKAWGLIRSCRAPNADFRPPSPNSALTHSQTAKASWSGRGAGILVSASQWQHLGAGTNDAFEAECPKLERLALFLGVVVLDIMGERHGPARSRAMVKHSADDERAHAQHR